MTLSLGIDIGTSGVRTCVLDAEGKLISTARAVHVQQDTPAIDAEKWWTAVSICISRQIEALKDLDRSGRDIHAISIDGTSGSMVLTDATLSPVSPALMYNSKGFDAEAKRIAASNAPTDHITQGSNSALARAMHLIKQANGQPIHLLHQADFIAAKLLGHGGLSDHNNALKTGFDPEYGVWPAWMESVIDPALLPKVSPVGTPWGTVSPQTAHALALNPLATVYAGTTDSIAAFLAAAPLELGAAVTSVGSTLAIKILSDARVDRPKQGLYSHKIAEYWLVGGASNTGGAVLKHFFDDEALATLSAQMDPAQPSGLDYYPLLSPGERFPVNDPSLEPRLSPRPADDVTFLKGLFEGIARIEAQCYRVIKEAGGPEPSILATAGGAAKNPILRTIREANLGLKTKDAAQTEAAYGAARIPQLFAR